jgi:hypothetical protein
VARRRAQPGRGPRHCRNARADAGAADLGDLRDAQHQGCRGLHGAAGRASGRGLLAVSIPGEANTLPAETTAEAASRAGIEAETAPSVESALATIAERDPAARVLICGSLYLAGAVLRSNG